MSKYTYNANKNSIEYAGKFVAYLNVIDANKIINLLNQQKQLKKENQSIQNKVIRLLDYVEKNGSLGLITRDEIKKWWNGDV